MCSAVRHRGIGLSRCCARVRLHRPRAADLDEGVHDVDAASEQVDVAGVEAGDLAPPHAGERQRVQHRGVFVWRCAAIASTSAQVMNTSGRGGTVGSWAPDAGLESISPSRRADSSRDRSSPWQARTVGGDSGGSPWPRGGAGEPFHPPLHGGRGDAVQRGVAEGGQDVLSRRPVAGQRRRFGDPGLPPPLLILPQRDPAGFRVAVLPGADERFLVAGPTAGHGPVGERLSVFAAGPVPAAAQVLPRRQRLDPHG